MVIQSKTSQEQILSLFFNCRRVVMWLQATCGSFNSWARHNTRRTLEACNNFNITLTNQNTDLNSHKQSSNLAWHHFDSQHPAVNIMDVTHIRCDRRGGCVWMHVCLASGEHKAELLFIRLQKSGCVLCCFVPPVCLQFSLHLSLSSSLAPSCAEWYGVYQSEHVWISSANATHLDKTFHFTSAT